MKKNNFLLICMVITICSLIGEVSMIGLIMFSVGFAIVVALLEFPLIYGGKYMKKITRRLGLAFGTITTIIALLGEVNMVAFIVFAIGFSATIFTLNKMVEEKSAEKILQ